MIYIQRKTAINLKRWMSSRLARFRPFSVVQYESLDRLESVKAF